MLNIDAFYYEAKEVAYLSDKGCTVSFLQFPSMDVWVWTHVKNGTYQIRYLQFEYNANKNEYRYMYQYHQRNPLFMKSYCILRFSEPLALKSIGNLLAQMNGRKLDFITYEESKRIISRGLYYLGNPASMIGVIGVQYRAHTSWMIQRFYLLFSLSWHVI